MWQSGVCSKPCISLNMDTIDMLQTDSSTLVTDKQSSGMYVGSSTAGTSNGMDPKFEELVTVAQKTVPMFGHFVMFGL